MTNAQPNSSVYYLPGAKPHTAGIASGDWHAVLRRHMREPASESPILDAMSVAERANAAAAATEDTDAKRALWSIANEWTRRASMITPTTLDETRVLLGALMPPVLIEDIFHQNPKLWEVLFRMSDACNGVAPAETEDRITRRLAWFERRASKAATEDAPPP